MRLKWLILSIAFAMLFMIGCEDNDDFEPIGYTGNMSESAQLLSFSDNEFVTSYDIALVYENSSYWVKLNTATNVLAVPADTTYDVAELPLFGYASDNDTNFVIGNSWIDDDTYNFNDNHSVQSNGQTFYVRTTDYQWIKLEILYGSQLSMKFRWSIDGQDDIIDTVAVNYTADSPVYYNFSSASEVTPNNWDLGFIMLPIYTGPEMGYMNMPSLIMNKFNDIQVTVITNQDFDDISAVPTSPVWNDDYQILGYEGTYEVLNYHHEITKVLIDNADYTYIFRTGSKDYKIRFYDYAGYTVVFDFDEL